MNVLLSFIIGLMVGGIVMTMITSIVQINKINELENKYISLKDKT